MAAELADSQIYRNTIGNGRSAHGHLGEARKYFRGSLPVLIINDE